MYTKIADEKLKTGENMEIGVVMAPDEDHFGSMMELLHHKGPPWLTHVERALKGDITGLEPRFYIGALNGQAIANIVTVEYNRTGIFGHVFTRPEHRRKGACTLVMGHQMEDFRQRGGEEEVWLLRVEINNDYADTTWPGYYPLLSWNSGQIPKSINNRPVRMKLVQAMTGNVLVSDMLRSNSYRTREEDGGPVLWYTIKYELGPRAKAKPQPIFPFLL